MGHEDFRDGDLISSRTAIGGDEGADCVRAICPFEGVGLEAHKFVVLAAIVPRQKSPLAWEPAGMFGRCSGDGF